MEIKAILCDVGGVLVRTRDTSGRHKWEDILGLERGQLYREVFSKDRGNMATIGVMSTAEVWKELQKKFSLTKDEIHQLSKDFFSGDQLNTPLFDYLMSIREEYPIAIISNAWDNAGALYRQLYHLNRLTDKIIISSEVGIRKPNEQIYKIAITALDVDPVNILFIDDTTENIREAKRLGMQTLHFMHTAPTIEKLQHLLSY